MSEGWKLFLDIFNAVGTVISLIGAVLSLWVLKRVSEIRGDVVLRAALPDLKVRMTTASQNLTSALKRKGHPSQVIAELRGLAHDLSVQVSDKKEANIKKLQEASERLILAVEPNKKDPDHLVALAAEVTTVLALITSAERDLKTWSLSK